MENLNPPPPPITPENPAGIPQRLTGDMTLKQFLMIFPFVMILIFILSAVKKNGRTVPVVAPTPTPYTSLPGQFCGGFAGVACPEGYTCKLDGDYPDAGGYCTPVSIVKTKSKAYTDELKTYLIVAPADWEWITHSSNFWSMHFITLKAPDNSVFQSSAEETNNRTLVSYLQERDKQNAIGWEGQPSKKILSSKNVTVGNYPGVERIEEWLAAGYTTVVTYFKVGDYIYEASIQPSEIDYQNSQVYKNYYQILSSFRLVSSANISPTCRPRPPCLDAEPRCLMPETEDMCPPKTSPTPLQSGCIIGGCSGEMCLDARSPDMASICLWKEEYSCLKYSTCERQTAGNCAWTQTPEYLSCLKNPSSYQ
jgi:hypothetical protein